MCQFSAATALIQAGDASRTLLRGLCPPLDVGDLQDGHQQLEGILDVGRAVGGLRGHTDHKNAVSEITDLKRVAAP